MTTPSDHRLVSFNCARPMGTFSMDNEFVRVFLSLLPNIFKHADNDPAMHWHTHGVRSVEGTWYELMQVQDIFPYPADKRAPDVCTMAGWESVEALRHFVHDSKPHGPGMKGLTSKVDHSDGANFVMWWAPRSQRFTLEDGWSKLEQLRTQGPSETAFDLSQLHPMPRSP